MAAYTQEMRERALIALMERYGDGVKRLCCVYLKDYGAAEDAAQETFIKAFRHIEALLNGEVSNEKAWITRIAINTCKDMLRSSWFRHVDRHQVIEELPLAAVPGNEENVALTNAVMRLPHKYREIILLYYYQEMNLRQCAQIMDISAPTATRRLQQAQDKLRKILEKEGGLWS